MLSRFHTIPSCHGQTDRQTERRTELLYQYRTSAAVCWRPIKTIGMSWEITMPRLRKSKISKIEDHHRSNPWTYLVVKRSKVKVAMSRGASDSCWTISRERKVPETPKLVERLPTPCTVKRTSFKVKRAKVKVTRPTNADIENVSYVPNGKACELQSWYADGPWRPLSDKRRILQSTEVKVARSRGLSDSYWSISWERQVPETPKLVWRLTTRLAITSSRFEVKRPINAETESVSHMNFKLSRRLEHALKCHGQL